MRAYTLALAALAVAAATGSAQQSSSPPSWSTSIGVGVIARPRYVGSDEYRVHPIPIVQSEYKGRLFAGVLGVGSYLVRSESFVWQAQLTPSNSRHVRDADALAGMTNRDMGAVAGSGVTYRRGAYSLAAQGTVGLGGGQGATGSVSAGTRRMLASRVMLELSSGATFADARNMRYDFGVSSAESARRLALIAAGDPRLSPDEGGPYRAGAGLRQLDASAAFGYVVSQRTTLMMFGNASRLSNEAARSPLVRNREGVTGGLMLLYGL